MQTVLSAAREVTLDIPVAAAVVDATGRIVSLEVNGTYSANNPIGHAEIIALQNAGKVLGLSRLDGHTLVTNLEPCPMCAGAIRTSRLSRLVFGAFNLENGACGSVTDIVRMGPRPLEVISGVLAEESSTLISDYFKMRR